MFETSTLNARNSQVQRLVRILFMLKTLFLIIPVLIILATLVVKGSSVISIDFLFTHPTDGMTADSFPFDHAFLSHVGTRIINEVRGINRVVYDVTSKPPGTIEWE